MSNDNEILKRIMAKVGLENRRTFCFQPTCRDARSLRPNKKMLYIVDIQHFIVRMKGLEPPRPETLDPKSNAATITPHAQVGNDFVVQR